jgi:DNA-binding transcriptional regulator PaaX
MDYEKPKSAVKHILLALVPYTRENLQLAFHPNQFFNELERISGYKQASLRTAMWKAQKRGLIEREGKLLKLTAKGMADVQPYVGKKLGDNVGLMVVFDIPEERAATRRRLRLLLRQWRFEQVQKSVWISSYDYHAFILEALREFDIESYVQVYECARLHPKAKP